LFNRTGAPVPEALARSRGGRRRAARATDPACGPAPGGRRRLAMKYGLLWLLGVPIPVLIVIWFLFH
jgi:hypothetical protein